MPTTLLTTSVSTNPALTTPVSADPAPTRRLPILGAPVPPALERPRAPLSPAGLAVARGYSGVRACSGTAVRGTARPRVRAAVVAAPAQGVLRLTRRGRVVVVLVAVMACAVLFSLGRHSAGAVVRTHLPLKTTTVQAGESLWAVATRVAPSADPRDETERIARTNRLSDEAVLTPGQVLQIPA